MSPRKPVDWEAVERAYRAGQPSVRALAAIHGVSEGLVRKKAKEYQWERDLTEKIKAEVRTKLLREGTRGQKETEAEIIALAVQTNISIIRGHQKSIGAGQKLVTKLLDELQEATDLKQDIEIAIAEETDGDKSPQRRDAMLRAVGLENRSKIIGNLSNALKTLVGLERQAFNLGDKSEEEPPTPAVLAERASEPAGDTYLRLVKGGKS
jgi:hypothetical protein